MTFPRSWYRPGRYYRLVGVIIALWALLSPPGHYYRPQGVIIAPGRYYRPLGVIIAFWALLSPPGRYYRLVIIDPDLIRKAIITPRRR